METFIALIGAISLGLRLYQIEHPNHVCWDEVHFGKYASYYINRTLFFDVHPPLGKIIFALSGYMTGYEGDFNYNKPGDVMRSIQYVGMRQVSALFGSAVVPISAATVWELSSSPIATILTAFFILSDTALTVMSRFILLDSILLFYMSLSCYCYVKHTKSRPFSSSWWLHLCGCGVSLACTVGVKFVGLFVVALIGLSVIGDLWKIVGNKSIPLEQFVQHILARIYTLIFIPVFVYCSIYVLHFIALSSSGPGDSFYSSVFQTSIINNPLYHAKMPEYVAYGSEITLKNYRTAGGYLHSHPQHYPKEFGAHMQQVTSYSQRHEGNHWILGAVSKELQNTNEHVYIKDGDSILLQHKQTKEWLYSVDEPAPLTHRQGQVGCYTDTSDNKNNMFKIKVVHGHQDDGRISPIYSVFQMIHINQNCSLSCKGRELPNWAPGQQEVTCNSDVSSQPASLWNIEEIFDARLPIIRLDWKHSRPTFFSRLIEAHLVMFANNQNLKPKLEEFRSRPWMWPLAYKGQLFSVEPHILMLGNPVTHVLILLLFVPTSYLFLRDMIIYQRSKAYKDTDKSLFTNILKVYRQMGWLGLAWLLHYLPFWPMTRVLYPHHYLPAYVFSCMFTGVSADHLLKRFASLFKPSTASVIQYFGVVLLCASTAASFYILSPIVYGYDSDAEDNPMLKYQVNTHWDF
ncbi:hypothetical protein EB796_009520 [Bugula neritina]|uniref:Protein O-mannosyl-transferase 2 n=1 Tax=Bugula neritina TaxID=10212 RepID=A0A7J7J2T2_BUGNE|nr:hypothetical protein EB796_021215 [Bugula neritina]KAF6032172.1 hypothetical protein EB796_009520 [Bugula neritina]